MGKDLRATPVPLKLHRLPSVDGTAWNLKSMQPFFPSLEKLFKTESLSALHEYGVKLEYQMESAVDEGSAKVRGKTIPVHRKTTMILSPFKTMRGDYTDPTLPKRTEVADDMQTQMQSAHTAAYVGALTSVALSESGCEHFPRVYGVYAGISSGHMIDVSDDYEDLCERPWFGENIGKTFELKLRSGEHDAEFTHTRGRRAVVLTAEDVDLGDIADMDADHVTEPSVASGPEDYDVGGDSLSDDEADVSSDGSDVFTIDSCS